MAWRDNPIGIVVDAKTRVDLKTLKAEGLEFVVVEGAVGPYERNPNLSQVVQAAYDNDLPILLMLTPWPDQEEYTHVGNIQSHYAIATGITTNHLHHGYVVNVDRNWTGTDYEEARAGTRPQSAIRWSTSQNISGVAKALLEYVKNFYGKRGRTTPVLVRTSDGFVQTHSPEMAAWVGSHPFFLADWRYRMPDATGAYNRYVVYPTSPTNVASLQALREALPPAEAKNPLVPGASTPLRFWEFSGRRFVHPAVTDAAGTPTSASFVLFNGGVGDLHTFLQYVPRPAKDTTAPGKITGVSAIEDDGIVEVSWDAPSTNDGVVALEVFRNGVLIQTVVNTGVDFIEDSPSEAGVYVYAVDALDAAGNRSPRSDTVTVVIQGEDDETPPDGTGVAARLEAAITAFARAWLDFNKE